MYISKHDRHIKILMYHRIVEAQVKGEMDKFSVCIDDFRNQLKILELLNFTPITFYDYKLYLEEKLTMPKKPIIITFDDGYLDTFELAIPTLLESDMRAVIFVMGDRSLTEANWFNGDGGRLMSNAQVILARSQGFEIGSHSMNHNMLTELSEFELKEEILNSRKSIENILGERIHSFAYPYGYTNERVNQVTRECGFTFGCGVYSGPPGFGDDFFDFRRLSVNKNTGIIQFLTYLLTPYQYAEWIYSKWKNQINKPAETNGQVLKKHSLIKHTIYE